MADMGVINSFSWCSGGFCGYRASKISMQARQIRIKHDHEMVALSPEMNRNPRCQPNPEERYVDEKNEIVVINLKYLGKERRTHFLG